MSIYENAQWIVLVDGMETAEDQPPYEFDIDRVFETTQRGTNEFYDWPVHMATKSWVDAGLFNDAFDHAIRHYSKASGEAIDEAMLSASYDEAYRIARQR